MNETKAQQQNYGNTLARPNLQDYKYERLRNPRSDFRLIVLEPSLVHYSPIRCRLEVCSRPTWPSYEAVSYVWGNLDLDHHVKVNGKNLAVTRSLVLALRDIRHRLKERIVWIDGICIDQSDDAQEERAAQVDIMRDIFSRASRVLAWLCEANKDVQRTFQTFRDPYAKRVHQEIVHWFRGERQVSSLPKHLVYFISLPWWSRVWIYQELVVAREVLFVSGGATLTWTELLRGVVRYSRDYLTFSKLEASISTTPLNRTPTALGQYALWDSNINAKREGRSRLRSHGHMDLVHVLSRLRGPLSQASDDRDRIFAVFKLSKEAMHYSDAKFSEANYRNSTEDVYINFARSLMETTSSLKILTQCELRTETDRTKPKFLPGWVPDWRLEGPGGESTQSWSLFKASGRSKAQIMSCSQKCVLELVGINIGRVQVIQWSRRWSISEEDHLERIIDWLYVPSGQPRLFKNQSSVGEYPLALRRGSIPRSDVLSVEDDLSPTEVLRIISHDIWWINGERRRIRKHNEVTIYEFLRSCTTLRLRSDISKPGGNALLGIPDLNPDLKTFSQDLSMNLAMGSLARISSGQNGIIAMIPRGTLEGDILAVFFGSNVPFVLRPEGELGRYTLVGTAYLHGYMDGEIMNGLKRGDYTPETFALV